MENSNMWRTWLSGSPWLCAQIHQFFLLCMFIKNNIGKSCLHRGHPIKPLDDSSERDLRSKCWLIDKHQYIIRQTKFKTLVGWSLQGVILSNRSKTITFHYIPLCQFLSVQRVQIECAHLPPSKLSHLNPVTKVYREKRVRKIMGMELIQHVHFVKQGVDGSSNPKQLKRPNPTQVLFFAGLRWTVEMNLEWKLMIIIRVIRKIRCTFHDYNAIRIYFNQNFQNIFQWISSFSY